ncbi:MAG: hypothetical protein Q9195_007005 [Heterodermia aff. obscurata]
MFTIGVGVPPQKVQVLPSTELSQTLVIIPDGCSVSTGDPSNCTQTRGGAYDSDKSSNWTSKNIFPINAEQNLGLTHNSDNGAYGYDELALPTINGDNVTLNQQLISGVATKDFYLGSLGLSSSPISFEDPPDTRPSLITSLQNANLIPSLSYAYTAGAFYRNQTGSLTLGGYDTSRFVPNDVSIEFATNPIRQLVVALKSITFSDSKSTDSSLLSDGILTLIDSTVPDIWLPLAACQSFEEAFGIEFEPISTLYLVNSTIHDNLLKQNASVTFELGSGLGDGASVNITLPYASFNLDVSYPLVPENKPSKYFPLRRAADDTQYTLGRTFLQESYLIVDYGAQNFSISQATVSESPAQVVAISASNVTESSTSGTSSPSPTSTNTPAIVNAPSHHSGFPVGAIAGIVVAVALIALAIGGWFLRKNLKKRKQRGHAAELGADAPLPKGRHEVEGDPAAEGSNEKRAVETNDYPVHTGMDSPPLEMGDDRVTFEGYYEPTKDHGAPMELGTEPIPRSELSSPEPRSGRASPTLLQARSELSTPDPQCAEMASPFYSTHSHPSPPAEFPSALSSPRSLQTRPSLRRSVHGRLHSTTSDESGFTTLPLQGVQRSGSQNSAFSKDGTPLRPAHIRKDSDDSAFTQDTIPATPHSHRLTGHQRRQDSIESTDTIPAHRPSHSRVDSNDSSTVSEALLSPSPFTMHHQPASTRVDEAAEEDLDQDSDSPLVGTSDAVPAIAQLGRRGSANLINQLSPPSSPSRSTMSIPRKEVGASPTPTAAHRRQESSSSAQQAPPSAYSHLSTGAGRVRSSSSGSRFEEDFREEAKGSFESRRK